MQAAQMAAEAAMQEAAREATSGSRSSSRHSQLHESQQSRHDSEMDLQYDDDEEVDGLNPEQIAFLKAMQAAEMGDQANLLHDLGVMGIGNHSSDSVQSLLQMLAQHDNENRRPDEHYLTIAQNGKVFVPTEV